MTEDLPPLAFVVLEGSSHNGAAFPSRLVLVCPSSPLPWAPPEEVRAAGVPAFRLDLLFN